MLGKSVGSYKITKELGEGGMGAVYLAEHTLMGKQAAVKVLLPQYCAVQEVVDRFFNEARSASMIKHPGIVDIYDFGTQEDGSAFIVMELLEGEPLSDLLEREPRLASERVALLGQQMARALQAAHELGIVHRDLKPDNIFLEPDSAAVGGERPKILDFGIAKLGGDLSDSSVKTRTGAIMGTPIFMSPEQCTGAGDIDSRSDVYSLGCILYSMVCGRPPFVKPGAGALIAAHITEVPQPLSALEPQVDSDLEAIIMSTLAKSPEERPQSMNALANALGSITGHNTARRGIKARANTAELFGNEAETPSSSDARLAKTHASTTLGSSAVGGLSTTEASPASAGGLPKVALIAGGLVAAAAIAFFVLKSGSSDTPDASAAAAAEPAPVVETPVVEPEPTPAPDLEPTTMTIELKSEPSGATVYRRADGVKLGTTPFNDELARGRGELDLLLKYPDHESVKVSVPLQEDFSQSIALAAIPAPEPKRRTSKTRDKAKSKVTTPSVTTPKPTPKEEVVKPVEKPKPKPDGSKWGELAN